MSLLFIALLVFIGLYAYFLPSIVAEKRNHHNALAIFWLNFFLGWSLLGWVASLVWACTVVKYGSITEVSDNTKTKSTIRNPTLKYIILITLLTVLIVFLYDYKYIINNKTSNINKNIIQPMELQPKLDYKEIEVDLEKQPFKTIYGTLTAVKTKESDETTLFLDNNKIMSSFNAIVIRAMQISDHIVLVIITNQGGSMGNTSYSLVDIRPDKTFIVNDVPNGWDDTEFSIFGQCINAKTSDTRSYADKGGYTLFTYCIDGSENKYDRYQFAKPDSYYKNKYMSYTSKQIYDIAVSDNCCEVNKNALDCSHACGYGEKYCFMFNSKIQHENDNYSQILENTCLNMDFINSMSNH